MEINFYKYHGTGNDFILIDNRMQQFLPSQPGIALLCKRHTGIGADGMILLEGSQRADFSMHYFNADGREATLCGNGGRCITAFAASLGLIENKTVFEATDGLHYAELTGSTYGQQLVRLKMNNTGNIREIMGGKWIDTGSPHLVIFSDNVAEVDVFTEGRTIRYNKVFSPDGVNVNFVEAEADGTFVRTYERGVENETLSCGTGAVASALVLASDRKNMESPVNIKTKGGLLKVWFEKTKKGFENIWLEGPVAFVYEGKVDLTYKQQNDFE